MKNNLYSDIKESIQNNFIFLKLHGFKDFNENQLAHEIHFRTENDYISIDIWFEAISSSPIWITINGVYIECLDIENTVLKECVIRRNEKYDDFFQLYLEEADDVYLEKIEESYADNGKEINELYLKECSEIIKRNITILSGKLEILNSNTAEVSNKKVQLASDAIAENKKITLEYQVFPDGCIDDAYEEFTSLDELNLFLKQRNDISNYRILD